ncbi:hypothetical protein D3C73_974930 [compost metagenome]
MQLISGIDIVFDEQRNTVQTAARSRRQPLVIKLPGNLQRVGIKFEHRIQQGIVFADPF